MVSTALTDEPQRYFGIVFQHSATRRRYTEFPDILGVDVDVLSSNLSLTIDTNETYTLNVIVCNRVTLLAM